MGVHHWTRYTGYKKECIDGLKTNLNFFCFRCHTSEDVGGCHRCPIGQANDLMVEYLKGELKPNKDLKKLLKELKDEKKSLKWIRLKIHFRPKKAKKKYIEDVKKSFGKGWNGHKLLISHWAKNSEECEKVITLLDNLKAKEKY